MTRRVSGLRSLSIAVVASVAMVCVLSAQKLDPRARLAGTWQRDNSRSIENRADWQRLDAPVARRIPCVDPPLRQEDWAYARWRDCYVEKDYGRLMGQPSWETVRPRLGVHVMTVLSELRIEATPTAAAVTGAPDTTPMTFSTAGARTTVPFGQYKILVKASWRNGELVQELSGEDQDVDFRVRRTFATSADGQTLTVTTQVEKPKLKPAVSDVVHVYTRSR